MCYTVIIAQGDLAIDHPPAQRQAEGGYYAIRIAPRGRVLQGVGLSSMRIYPIGEGPEDDKDGQEA